MTWRSRSRPGVSNTTTAVMIFVVLAKGRGVSAALLHSAFPSASSATKAPWAVISWDRTAEVFAFKTEADAAGLAAEVASGLALAVGRMIAAAETAATAAAARMPVFLVTRLWLKLLT